MLTKSEWNRKVALNRWKKAFEKETKNIEENSKKYPEMKARVIAYLMGDGMVTTRMEGKQKRHSVGFFPDDKKMLDAFLIALKTIYGLEPKVKELDKYYEVRIDSKPAVVNLLEQGSFRSLEWRVPKFQSLSEKREWLRAFYDCEAYVGLQAIVIQSVNQKGLEDAKALLKEFGIESRMYSYQRKDKPTWNTNYHLHITAKDERRKFLKEIGFNHSRKQEKLQKFAAVA